jgi:glycosyltransferase involved in cell wall biosynthesis
MKKIAVITPYYKEPLEVLKKCHESVMSQSISATHFFIADGFPREELTQWNIKHISLAQGHDDNGDTPRGIGGLLADVEGYDFVAYLDADNWFHENHLQSMLDKWIETKSDVICSFRTYHQINGEEILVEEPDENSFYHVDTSCFFIHKNAFDIIRHNHKGFFVQAILKACGAGTNSQ